MMPLETLQVVHVHEDLQANANSQNPPLYMLDSVDTPYLVVLCLPAYSTVRRQNLHVTCLFKSVTVSSLSFSLTVNMDFDILSRVMNYPLMRVTCFTSLTCQILTGGRQSVVMLQGSFQAIMVGRRDTQHEVRNLHSQFSFCTIVHICFNCHYDCMNLA
jgi:hypothetical protein